jgi:hypothetical protein
MAPSELVFLPALQRHAAEQVGQSAACGGVGQPAISGALMMRPPRLASASATSAVSARSVVLVAPSDGDADDGHARFARLVHQTVGVPSAKQFAKQDEDITLAENVVARNFP